jgi:Xaa-Pro dipeptidase
MKNLIPSTFFRQARRDFLQGSVSAGATVALSLGSTSASQESSPALPQAFASLKPLGPRVNSISSDEFRGRIARAQQLMTEASPKFEALFVAPGTSLYYFTGIRWWPSERLLALLIPRTGDPILICAGFEEGRLREQLRYTAEVRVWQEDESPARLAAQALSDRSIRTGRVGVDETTYFTFFDHMRAAAPSHEFISGDPVTIGCRGVKSAHELELMRLSCEATCDVFRAVFASLREGMTQSEVGRLVEAGYSKMSLRGDALVLFGPSAALPHGSIKPQSLKEGDVVLIDGGCKLEGYDSDITRTAVFGKPTDKMRKAYNLVRGAQNAALDAARSGKLSGTVDDAARAVISGGGFGPDYKFFTHRLGHGIGLDGHEHPYLVRGSKTVLASGMTFSNEPGIYIPGEFGIRCEDDMVITRDGPAQILSPSFQNSLEKPFG